jgi:hypothetical protein
VRSPYAAFAIPLALGLLSPNLVWQAAHGWPIFEVLRGDLGHRPALRPGFALEYRDALRNAVAFIGEQLLYTNPLAAPIWIAGIVAPFRLPALRDVRYISFAYLIVLFSALLLSAKGYYIAGFYGSLFALGAVAVERWSAIARAILLTPAAIVAILAMPFSIPVLPVDGLIAYSRTLQMTGKGGAPAHLMQPVFAEEFGWERLARDVAIVYLSLPPETRKSTAIYADTYADAAAIDFFGASYALPPAISSQNNYYLWGTRGHRGDSLIAIGATRIDLLRRYYRDVRLVRTSTEPYKWIVEGPSPIYLCSNPIARLDEIWPHLRWYGA